MRFSGRRKFSANWTKDVRGVNHPSEKEAKWANRLYAREERGEIRDLTITPKFEIKIAQDCPYCAEHGVKVCDVELDAGYTEVSTGEYVHADYKGIEGDTPVSKLKRKLAEIRHGITVTLFGPAAAKQRKKDELTAFKRAEREKARVAKQEAKRAAKRGGAGQLNMTL